MKKIRNWIKRLSPTAEFLIVISSAFGYFIVSSCLSFVFGAPEISITTGGLREVLLYEIVVGLCLAWFLNQRGWTLSKLGFEPNWTSTILGILLIPVFSVVFSFTGGLVIAVLSAFQIDKAITTPGLGIAEIILVSMVNPFFEEVFVCGYVIHFFEQFYPASSRESLIENKRIWSFIAVSTVIRVLYHLYQPVYGIASIMIMGLICGTFYASTNRLWSLVVMHGLLDLYGLLYLSNSYAAHHNL